MIIRVWGVINSTEVDFQPIPNKPDYWEGYAPRVKGLQDIEIWAENDKGARGHYRGEVLISWYSETHARLTLAPYSVRLVDTGQNDYISQPYLIKP